MKKLFFFITTLSALSVCVNAQNTSPYWSLAGNSNATSSSKLGTTNTVNLRFFTKNLERMRLDTSGRVGIGTATPDSRLQVNSSSGQNSLRAQVNGSTKFLVSSNGGVAIGSSSTPPANGLYVSGNVGIGTATPSAKLHVVTTGTAVFGNSTGGSGYGVYGSSTYLGVYGSGANYGVYGSATTSYGVYGVGGTHGVYGSGNSYGVYGNSNSGTGVRGISSSLYGVYGSSGYLGVWGSGTTYGVYASATTGYGVYGTSNYLGTYGSGGTYGVYGSSSAGWGVAGYSTTNYGVYGESSSGNGGRFYSVTGYGIWAATGLADNNWAGVFDGNVYTYNAYQASDKNLKKNIKEFEGAMSIINKLKPKNYEFITEGKLASLNLPRGQHYGLIAQDVETVLPNLVKESVHDLNFSKSAGKGIKPQEPGKEPTGTIQGEPEQKIAKDDITIKAVNYTELIPIMIKAMQEQDAKIIEQQTINENLQNQINKLNSLVETLSKQDHNATALSSTAFLKQNAPNPFNNNTTIINYYIPDNAGYAQIKITDIKGSIIKSFNTAKGEGQIKIRSSELPAGTYNYTLYINNKTVDTKQMVLLK